MSKQIAFSKLILGFVVISTILTLISGKGANAQSGELEAILNWDTKVSHNLTPMGPNLFGDNIDYKTGSVSFEQTDISIPGNNSLAVAVKRRLSRGLLYDLSDSAEFGDWEIVVPRISAITSQDSNFRTGDRCSGNNQLQEVEVGFKTPQTISNYAYPFIRGSEYSNGVEIDTLEYGSERLFARVDSDVSPYPNDTKFVSNNNMVVTCLDSAEGGGEGFKAVSANGITYLFNRFYELETEELTFTNYRSAFVKRYKTIIAATRVTDVHGNFVDYTYDSNNRLTAIESNDGRLITLGYDQSSNAIKSVTANGRVWTYGYDEATVAYGYAEWGDNWLYSQEYETLTTVTRPDGLAWNFLARDMSRHPGIQGCTPADNPIFNRVTMTHPNGAVGRFKFDRIRRRVGGDNLQTVSVRGVNNGPNQTIISNGASVDLACASYANFQGDSVPNEPNIQTAINSQRDLVTDARSAYRTALNFVATAETTSEYNFAILVAFDAWNYLRGQQSLLDALVAMARNETPDAPGDGDHSNLSSQTLPANVMSYKSMLALVEKKISLPLQPSILWTIDYEEAPLVNYSNRDTVPDTPEAQRTNYTKVHAPDGTVAEYNYHWDIEEFGGNLKTVEVFGSETESNPSQTITYDYVVAREDSPWRPQSYFVFQPSSDLFPTLVSSKVTEQDGDTFTEENIYNRDASASNYSFGFPVAQRGFSSVNTAKRGTDIEYEHNLSNWILGLTKKNYEVATTGARREVSAFVYNANGQPESQTRYGENWGTYSYYGNGQIEQIEDALGRITKAENWKRGTPQRIIKAFGTADEITTSQTVDDNGWVTSQKDGKNQTTLYTRDPDMGRLTRINPPGTWTDTVIAYSFPSVGGAVQTITKGTAVTTINYDSMLRNVEEHQEETITGWESYVNRTYDGLGRQTFESFPSTSASETNGTTSKYDGLGRVYETLVNDNLVSNTDFLAGHKTRVYDALGNYTETTKNGYGETVSILQPEGIKTEMTYNQYGQMTKVRQLRGPGGSGAHVNKAQSLYYDAQQRLCKYFTTEGRGTLYNYDAAGQVTATLKGQGWTDPCDPNLVASTDEELALTTYDNLGRVKAMTYPNHANTDGFRYDYDDNGNQTKAERLDSNGNLLVEQFYNYNSLNLPGWSLTRVLADASDGTPQRQFYMPRIYTSEGFLSEQRTPGGVWVDHDPDGFGRNRSVSYETDSGAVKVELANAINYHANGTATSYNYGHGGSHSQTLDARQRADRTQSSGVNGAAIFDLTLGYDPNSRVTSQTDAVNAQRSRNFIYDDAGRLTQASAADPLHGTIDYTYDALGNLRRKDFTGGQWDGRNVSLTYNGVNRLAQSLDRNATNNYAYTGYRSAAYDSRGNMSRLGALNFEYDMSDQPVRIHGNSTKANGSDGSATDVTHSYDAHKRRVKSVEADGTVRYNIFDASGTLVQVFNAGTNTRTDYIPGPAGPLARVKGSGLSSTADEITYLHTDHLGTARAGTDKDGVLLWEDFHTPFGDSLIAPAANDNQGDYTGHIRDTGSGLTYMQARYYDPVIGRFLSVDPVTFMGTGNPGYFNRYAYTFNNPINGVDLDGERVFNFEVKAKSGVWGILGGGGSLDVSFDTQTLDLTGSGGVDVGFVVGKFRGGQWSTGASGKGIDGAIDGSGKISANGSVDFGTGKLPKPVKNFISKVTGGKINSLSGSVSHEFASVDTNGNEVKPNLPSWGDIIDSAQGGAGTGLSASLTVGGSVEGTVNLGDAFNGAVEDVKEAFQDVRDGKIF